MNHTPLESLGILSNVLQSTISLPYRAAEGQLSHSFLAEHVANVERALMRPQLEQRAKSNARNSDEQSVTEAPKDDRGSTGRGEAAPGVES